jgi:drug/metabolite transporter (DMT)-like permease
MDFLYPLIAVISDSAAQTLDRLNFKKHTISATNLMWVVFVGMFGSLLIYVIMIGKPLPQFTIGVIALLTLIALVSFTANVFDYLSLKVDDITLRQPMLGFEPILAGLFGYIFFPNERKPAFLVALIVSLAVVHYGIHRRKLGKNQSRGIGYLFLAVVCYALLPSIYKVTLPHINPEYIAFFRIWAILLLTTIFMPIKISLKPSNKVFLGILAGIINAVGAVAYLYAVASIGVVQTSLLLVLAPVLIYISGYFILREKIHVGELVASIFLAIIVIGSTIIW